MKISSAHFEEGQDIPKECTFSGKNISPEMLWDDPPPQTRSFVIIADDPDASTGIWTHWLAYNIPADRRRLPANMESSPRLPDGIMQGRNDFRKIGYSGPHPLEGSGPHRYIFRIYALDSKLPLPAGASKAELERAMQGHILDQSQITARYQR